MRENWTETTLGELVHFTIGKTPPRKNPTYWTTDLDRPFCTIADMTSRSVKPQREGVTAKAEEDGKAKRFPAGSLLMSFKLTLGRVGFAEVDLFPNEAIARLLPKDPSRVDARWLALAIEVQDLHEYAGRAVKGNTLNRDSLMAIPLSLPPLAEQKRIVDLLEAVDDAIQSGSASEFAAAQAARAVLSDMLEADDPPMRTLGDVADWFSGGTPRAGDPTYYENGTIPWAVIGDLTDGPLRHTSNAITEAGLAKAGKRMAPPGAVMIAMYGSVGTLGLSEITTATNQAIAWGVCGKSVLPEYVFLWLLHTRSDLIHAARGATQKNINRKMVREHPIAVPTLAAQQRIVETVRSAQQVASRAGELAARLRSLREGLLREVLSGEHAIPASYDELLGDVA